MSAYGDERRPLRADSERTERKILEAAERVLSDNPTFTMEQIAEAAGVARTTIHRRFATREALLEAMVLFALRQVEDAIDAGRPEKAPAVVALHQVTANVIQIKSGWRFTIGRIAPTASRAAHLQASIHDKCMSLLGRVQQAGLIHAEMDLDWARRTYYALLEQAIQQHAEKDDDPDALAELVVGTLLHGVGTTAQHH